MRPTSMRPRLHSFLLAAAVLVAVGCGGGGGGVSGILVPTELKGCTAPGSKTTLAYATDWGAAPASASQLIETVGSDGSVVRTDLLNRTTGSTLTLNSVSAAVYSMRVTLYAGANATGAALGVSQQTLDLCAGRATDPTVTFSTQNSGAPDATFLSVSGSGTAVSGGYSLYKGLTLRLFPTVMSGGKACFFDASKLTYSLSGSVGSVSNGVFTASAAGTGSVRASYPGVAASAQNPVGLTVLNSPAKSAWTVLVYLNAANDLYSFGDLNVNQMERVAGNPANLRIVTQWKQSTASFPSSSFDGTRRYLISPDTTNAIASQLLQSNMTEPNGSPLDMGKAKNLLEFVQWGKATYPADHYALVIWNHGNGWRTKTGKQIPARGFSYDDQTGSSIQTWELGAALGGERFDIVAWDCSLMQMLEVAYEMRGNADYIVGSEESPPGEGYPYDSVLAAFRDTPTQPVPTLAKNFVDKTLAVPAYSSRKITQSVLKTSALPALASAVDALGTQLTANAAAVSPTANLIRADGQGYSVFTNYRYFYDLVDICTRFEASSPPAGVATAAQNVRSAVAAALVHEGHNANSQGSRGISIDFSPPSYAPSMSTNYRKMQFGAFSWDEWLLAQM